MYLMYGNVNTDNIPVPVDEKLIYDDDLASDHDIKERCCHNAQNQADDQFSDDTLHSETDLSPK